MTLLVLLGPTAVGKTELALSVAEHFQCPILNCDSRQLFRDLRIGTASPTTGQLDRVKHYFVGTLALDEYYSAAKYESDVLSLIEQLRPTHDYLLLTGGSMMYLDAVCKGIDDIPTIDDDTRQLLKERYEREGLEPLLQELRLLDPEHYAIVDRRNPKRAIHALEVCYTSGRTYTSYRMGARKTRDFRIVKIGLNRPREELFARINQRVEQMLADGLIDEAKALLPYRHLNALNTVGYKEIHNYLDGTWTLEHAIEKMKKNTRDYAKKQLTWFRRDGEIHWFHPCQKEEILQFIRSL
ncbi:MAG: tRNA (adenosine(37)-N6)-dimethylallyltransferase MiaA [Bacteroidaceae bacterium]|nr:tRNA (adenosine(37)-N6)-dimethylallyltransferase MiaA [Bacteroidaceae bacterium]